MGNCLSSIDKSFPFGFGWSLIRSKTRTRDMLPHSGSELSCSSRNGPRGTRLGARSPCKGPALRAHASLAQNQRLHLILDGSGSDPGGGQTPGPLFPFLKPYRDQEPQGPGGMEAVLASQRNPSWQGFRHHPRR